MEQIEKVINIARKILIEHPFDQVHDLTHHERVLKLAIQIADTISQKVNVNNLSIACMWHDIMLPNRKGWSLFKKHKNVSEICLYLNKLLTNENFPQDDVQEIINAIKYHEFNHKQINLIGQILYDADKLDALNPQRWQNMIRAITKKTMSSLQVKIYVKVVTNWLESMRNKYHFEESRRLHDHRLRQLINDKEKYEFALKYGLNLKEFLQKR